MLWFRLKLPFQLNHVNIYLIEDDRGWLVLDTGLATDDCRAGWDRILSGPLKGQRLSGMLQDRRYPLDRRSSPIAMKEDGAAVKNRIHVTHLRATGSTAKVT